MKRRDIRVSADKSEIDPWRLDRLQRVIGYVCALADFDANDQTLDKLESLYDHKGELWVYWKTEPTEEEKKFVDWAWSSAIGDISKSVGHVTPKSVATINDNPLA